MKDTAKHQGLRNQLVSVLQQKGITDTTVLDAIKKIPRHLFLNSSFEDYAYQDKAFPIGAGQTISQPYTVALCWIQVRLSWINCYPVVVWLKCLILSG